MPGVTWTHTQMQTLLFEHDSNIICTIWVMCLLLYSDQGMLLWQRQIETEGDRTERQGDRERDGEIRKIQKDTENNRKGEHLSHLIKLDFHSESYSTFNQSPTTCAVR